MKFAGSERIAASRERVYDFVTDPRNFSKGIPEVRSVEVLGPDRFRVVAKLGVSSIGAPFVIDFHVTERDRPRRARLSARGRGAGSSVDLDIEVELSADGEATSMGWDVDAKVVGILASLGQRVMEPVASQIARGVFARIRENLEGGSSGGDLTSSEGSGV
jgi:carbon monoxide dehydrogenase subunit G